MFEMRETGMVSKAWPFEEARRILNRYENYPQKKAMYYSKRVTAHLVYLILGRLEK